MRLRRGATREDATVKIVAGYNRIREGSQKPDSRVSSLAVGCWCRWLAGVGQVERTHPNGQLPR